MQAKVIIFKSGAQQFVAVALNELMYWPTIQGLKCGTTIQDSKLEVVDTFIYEVSVEEGLYARGWLDAQLGQMVGPAGLVLGFLNEALAMNEHVREALVKKPRSLMDLVRETWAAIA